MRLFRKLAVSATFVASLSVIPYGSANAVPSCTGTPNLYAEGNYGGYFYGVQSTIVVGSVSAPPPNNFTVQHVYVGNGASGIDGLELGWFIGQGVSTFYTTPHFFASNFDLPGYSEQDGTSAPPGSNYWYSTWWSGHQRYYRVDTTINGSIVWNSGSPQSSNASGPVPPNGSPVVGEEATKTSGLSPGASRFESIQYLQSNGSWSNWTFAPTLCANPNFVVSFGTSPYRVSTGGTTK